MGEVIQLMQEEDGSGYITSKDCKKITGVYVNNIAALVSGEKHVYLGTKLDEGGVDDALLTDLDDMDRFCIMWLGINNPSVLKEDE